MIGVEFVGGSMLFLLGVAKMFPPCIFAGVSISGEFKDKPPNK